MYRRDDSMDVLDVLTDRTIFDESVTGCWLWQGPVHPKSGYGQVRKGRRLRYCHQWAWEHFRGPMPEGHEPDHLCRTPNCWNPDHLEAVTHAENVRRGLWGPDATRARAAARTHCTNGHRYTEATTHVRPDGRRRCRTCRNERYRRTGQ